MAAVALAACGSPYYTSDPIEAWVVDADTGQPIEGAVVTANWQLVSASLDTGGRKLRQLEVLETTTDKNGRFYFPGFTKINFTLDELREEDPQILIFKPGFRYLRVSRQPQVPNDAGARRKSPVTTTKLTLEKASTDPTKYAFELDVLTTNLSGILYYEGPARVNRMINALSCERRRLNSQYPKINLSIPGESEIEVRCESTK